MFLIGDIMVYIEAHGRKNAAETIYFAGGCLWGVQEFIKTLSGVVPTEAGRANGTSSTLGGEYDV